ncbi:hypothetical protein Pmani_030878 [Petrolisthes manimaculis]|uniref:Large ribosomal subunit protein bL27m n=1 Tax=Petrolisthes manimaculis TaxID=1843537 RepID=A0AAE1NUR1_9EUCA|nr:hypothetical protein Pmani_030878 [Petrolisthes manimaculis]
MTSLVQRILNHTTLLPGNVPGWLICARNASKKSSGSSRNSRGRTRGKHRGILKIDGDYVTEGTLLVRQLGLDYLPGLNVGIGRNRTLYAMYHGRVVMTTERFIPNWEHKVMRRFGSELKELHDIPIYKTYFHILTEPQKTNFKLIDQV